YEAQANPPAEEPASTPAAPGSEPHSRKTRRARHRGHRILLILGAIVLLTGAGIGLWLATSRSSSPNSKESTANQMFHAGLQAQLHGNSALAVNDYLRSLTLDPMNQVAWYDLGLIEQQSGYTASAQHDYQESIAVDPRYVPALYNLGTVVASSDPAEA